MYDIHTHLYWHTYDEDRDAVLTRARAAGVERMFVVGCSVEESQQCVDLAERYPELSASVGIHPQTWSEAGTAHLTPWVDQLKKLAQGSKKVVAIGECGLEYFSHDPEKPITEEQKEWQREGFTAQIELAKELKLPLIVHCRTRMGDGSAYREALRMIQETQCTQPAILHCYMGDTEVTRAFLDLPNVYFSFTANITYPVKKSVAGTKNDLSETVKLVPLDRMFTETDCPFLAPQSVRGERNEPAFVQQVLATVAGLKTIDFSAVESAIQVNYQSIFKKIEE